MYDALNHASTIEIAGSVALLLAVLHTFLAPTLRNLERTWPAQARLWHVLGDFEIAFALWAALLLAVMVTAAGPDTALDYVAGLHFTEPLFVFVIMLIAAGRPVLQYATAGVRLAARRLPLPPAAALYFCILAWVPLLGSFITEPAAMTLAALMLGRGFLEGEPARFRYATLAVLFVNISIGGVLTAFAAPPVLMVAARWGWDTPFMLSRFGWKMAVAVLLNAALATAVLRGAIAQAARTRPRGGAQDPGLPPPTIGLAHCGFLAAAVVCAHHPLPLLAVLAGFLAYARLWPAHQSPLIVRESLAVALFLAALVVLGGQQHWWLQPLLERLDGNQAYFGALGLTALTDNAALTYLASLTTGLPDDVKTALMAGAVTGGGLTVIANAPNPAGLAMLKSSFPRGVRPLALLAAALPPTLVAIAVFRGFEGWR